MKNKYIDLVEQTFDWPAEEFELTENVTLAWNDLDLMPIVKQYGTPLRMTYLPKIDENIQRARRMFHVAMAKVDYDANYHCCSFNFFLDIRQIISRVRPCITGRDISFIMCVLAKVHY